MDGLITIVLAGGVGERFKPLTLQRAKAAVPFGGKFRIIDFTLSNCINSGARHIYILLSISPSRCISIFRKDGVSPAQG